MKRAFLLVVISLFACDRPKHAQPVGARQMQGDGEVMLAVPDFLFQERSGKTVSRKSLEGKVWIVSCIFTTCKLTCIPMFGEYARLQEEFKDEPDLRLVAMTVDPDHDTIEVLSRFARGYNADPEKWLFIRNTIEETRKLAHEGLKIQWHPDDRLIHSTYIVLVDRQGRIRGYFNQTQSDRMEALRTTLKQVLAEKSP